VGDTSDLEFRGDSRPLLRGSNIARGREGDVVLGIQWGDEGKGRVVDSLLRRTTMSSRASAAATTPATRSSSAIANSRCASCPAASAERPKLFIGGGTVVSLEGLARPNSTCSRASASTSRASRSRIARTSCSRITRRSIARRAARGGAAIGTTGRGIGPAYTDKVARSGITFGDLRIPMLADKIRAGCSRARPWPRR
jgi:adenylosuccinate synthase